MGSALHVYLPESSTKGSEISVAITYATTKSSTALQWLAKEYVLISLCQSHSQDETHEDRLRERASPICSANANQSMHAL